MGNWSDLMVLVNAACYMKERRKQQKRVRYEEEEKHKRKKTTSSSCDGTVIKIQSSGEGDDGEGFPQADGAWRKRKNNGKANFTSTSNHTNKKKFGHYAKVGAPSQAIVERVLAIARLHGGSCPVLLASKQVTSSDIDGGQNRLLIGDKNKEILALLENQLKLVDRKRVNDKDEGLLVTVVDGEGNVYRNEMGPDERGRVAFLYTKLKYLSSNGGLRVIGPNYKKFVKTNKLAEGPHAVHVWVFYVDQEGGGSGDGAIGEGSRETWLVMVKEVLKPVANEEQQQGEVEPPVLPPLMVAENKVDEVTEQVATLASITNGGQCGEG